MIRSSWSLSGRQSAGKTGTFSTDILTQASIFLQSTRLKLYSAVLDRFQVPSYSPMSVNQAFLLATHNGGLALNRTDLGVIDIGAKTNILIWNGRSPALLGWADPVAAVILHTSVGDIEGVLVDGGWVKKAGKLVIPGYEKVQDRFLVAAKKIQDKLRALPTPLQNGNFLTGYPYGDVLRVDALRGEGDGYGVQYVN
ncbi:metal-dependent hydrolase [Rhypophila sp. PSN 637]